MRTFGKWLGRLLLAIVLMVGGAFLFAPKEPVDIEISFDEGALPENLDLYLVEQERRFPDIVPGTEKRIVWAGESGERTALSVIYLHGFSATSEEIRPVPDLVAEALGANLFFTRLTGHGRGGPAMAEPEAGDWIEDTAQALAIGRALGEKVLVISTSTGGPLAAIAATDASQIDSVKGIVFVSPNFRLRNSAAPILAMPFGRWWGPLIVGKEIGFEPASEEHRTFWTSRYPSVAAFPMGALVRYARRLDYSGVTAPGLFIFSEADQVVSPKQTWRMVERWGGPTEAMELTLGPGNDALSHVLAGDILSPDGNRLVVNAILTWVNGL